MDTAIFLSGTTRGGALEGICRSFATVLRRLDIDLVEISLNDLGGVLAKLRTMDIGRVRFAFSCAGMGMDLSITRNGREHSLWQELCIPCMTHHGDSPAYFFDRHVVPSNNFISLYAFSEHLALRRRLPHRNGPVAQLSPVLLDEMATEQIDRAAKLNGTLLFLKNGKDPQAVRRSWASCMAPRTLRALLELADALENDLDHATADDIDNAITRYFADLDLQVAGLTKLRLFLLAQLDDYLRAVKCTRIATALMDFPVEIRGNNWHHLDFSGKKATYIDDCNYVDSIGLIRNALGVIDMSANTASSPHDRVMRAFGARTLCLTNAGQTFMEDLPYSEDLTFSFEQDCLQDKVSTLLNRKAHAVDMGVEVAERFRALNPPERAFETMLDYAAFARLDQTPARPAGLQDFFLWPPVHA